MEPWIRRHPRLITFATLALAAVFALTNRTVTQSPAPINSLVAHAQTTVADIRSAKTVANSTNYLGFDTYQYPGDVVMQAWRNEDVPYQWVGYYLPAPCHKGTTWVGKRERLTAMGWGLAIIYVGQQSWAGTPRTSATTWHMQPTTVMTSRKVRDTSTVNGIFTVRWITKRVSETKLVRTAVQVPVDPAQRPLDQCNANLLGSVRGQIEGADAIARTEAEGFARGSVIFLDIERMDRIPAGMRDYYRAWTAALLADGRYVPGFYAHKANAASIYTEAKAVFTAAGSTREPPFWIAGGRDFSPERSPEGVGQAFAAMWQGVLDVVQVWKGYSLPIDVNVSFLANPSAPIAGQ